MSNINLTQTTPINYGNNHITKYAVNDLVTRIVTRFQPEKVILFGSIAKGSSTINSDVDLLIVMDTELSELQQAVEIRQFIRPEFALDIIVRRPDTVNQRLSWGDKFLKEIINTGIVLHESTHP